MEKSNSNYGADKVKGLGMLDQGIPSYNKEPETEPLVSLKNKFSAQHDCSMQEAMRMVGGKGTSAQDNEY